MTQKILFSLVFLLLAFQLVNAQDNSKQVLLTIDGQDVTRDEFERIYTKNNQNPAFDSLSLNEYMDLFVNFKLKVKEAEALGMDTIKSFVLELEGYRTQLEKPYFTDENVDELLMQEAYERMKWNIRASHILILCDENALPVDTLKAYNSIADIRKKALKGEDFNKLAATYSQDPSAKSNNGDLGYFSAFAMVYPFETGAYNTPVGKISEIVRTRFGYHIIKVTDKREDMGQVKVAHLMRAVPQGSPKEKDLEEKTRIQAFYDSIQAGVSFDKMVKEYSDDRGTSQKGGELPYFSSGRMIPEFEQAAFALKNIGDISKPIKTSYGYHIIKLLDVKPLESYETLKPSIKNKISKDIRAQRGKQLVLERLSKEYNVKYFVPELAKMYPVIDSTIYKGEWNAVKADGMNKTLFTIADTNVYTQHDFAASISMDGIKRVNKPLQLIVDEEFKKYTEKCLTDFEKSRLEIKYPDFRHLVKEYHDGILLFNLTDEMVWSKAVEDTTGLKEFYAQNKNNYMWGDRVEATLYTLNQKALQLKVEKLALNVGKKNLDPQAEVNKFLAKETAKDTSVTLVVVKNKFSKGENHIVDAVTNEKGLKQTQEIAPNVVIVYVNGPVAPEAKKLSEARGLITADYQTYLEKQWLTELKTKYAVVIHQEVFNAMIK